MDERILRIIDANFTDKTSVNERVAENSMRMASVSRPMPIVCQTVYSMGTFLRVFSLFLDIANRANTAAAAIFGFFGIFR
jgi:hypothetical protein